MYGYIYLTINLINNRKYIGQHKSDVFDPDYKGSGKILKQAFEKYGWENFETILLFECNSREELNQAEINEICKRNAVKSTEYYNISGGGEGWLSQWARISFRKRIIQILHTQKTSKETCRKRSESGKKFYLEHPERREVISNQMRDRQKDRGYRKGIPHTEETKKKMSVAHKGKACKLSEEGLRKRKEQGLRMDVSGEKNGMYGKTHSDKSKGLMSEKRSLYNQGCCWLNNGEIDRFVKDPLEIQKLLNEGFIYGRMYKPRKSSTIIESITEKKDLSE